VVHSQPLPTAKRASCFFHNGAWHSFIVGISLHPKGTAGPPPVMSVRLGKSLFSSGKVVHLKYDHVDPEKDVLIYRVVEEGPGL